MTLDDLAPLVPFDPDELRQLYQTFRTQTGSSEVVLFVDWLADEGHIDDAILAVIERSADTELSGMETLITPAGTPVPRAVEAAVGDAYTSLGMVGAGAMGQVLLVREHSLGRRVAFKRLLGGLNATPHRELFYREARITAQLEHPGIVPIYAYEDQEGKPAYTMKLVEGVTLAEYIEAARSRLRRGEPLGEEYQLSTRLRHFLRVCEAIDFAHSRGVLHRDLKPANIMIGPYAKVYVMDWGIALPTRLGDDGIRLEDDVAPTSRGGEPGSIEGTPAYMAPEHARGQADEMGPHSDQYSLGLILHEMVTLAWLAPDDDAVAALSRAMAGYRPPVRPFHADQGRLPRELVAVIDRATRRSPKERYPTVAALAEDIRRYLDGLEVLARPDSGLQRLARWLSHHRQTTLMLLLGLIGLIFASATFSLIRERQARHAAAMREAALGAVLTATARQSDRINAMFLTYEGLLRGLAAAAGQALALDGSSPEGVYWAAMLEETAPADFQWSEHYGRDVSVGWPAFVVAPDVLRAEVEPLAHRLAALRFPLRDALLDSAGPDVAVLSPELAEDVVRSQGGALVWAFIGFEEGLHLGYPGKAGYPEGYDPRKRPWYTSSKDSMRPRWGALYEDAMGKGLLLPCTMALRDGSGALRGVAGVELTFTTVADELLRLSGVHGVDSTWLLDERNNVVIGEDAQGRELPEQLSAPPLAAALDAGRSGYLELSGEGGEQLVIFQHLERLGWTYLVIGDSREIFGR